MDGVFSGNVFDSFEKAYDSMLKTIKEFYPMAKIICGTLMRTEIKGRNEWNFPECFVGVSLEDYNDAIRRASWKNHCYLADVSVVGAKYETLDGAHPTARGHITIANAWLQCLMALGMLEPYI